MKFSISFWFEGVRYKIIVDTKEMYLNEILKCIDEQYALGHDNEGGEDGTK